MEDKDIIRLYFERSEKAISETALRYGALLSHIAFGILRSREDAEECVNDTYMRAWNSIPPSQPKRLSAFLGKITRNLSLNRYERVKAKKRGGGSKEVALEELEECLPAAGDLQREVEDAELAELINGFLDRLKKESRIIFMRRYWYFCTVSEIAEDMSIGESKVKMSLLRTRKKLKQYLEKQGVAL
ncbi:MAG: RNA polymerase sigma factor [Oscillospiraceae bacterium]|nr:RNA polymerase sigma factor [Oscillospiraceae bacterium]